MRREIKLFVICVFVECPVYMHFADTQIRRWSNNTYYCFESTMVVEICNANVAYSVKQLTADWVDETSVHHGFNVDNDYNIRFRTV